MRLVVARGRTSLPAGPKGVRSGLLAGDERAKALRRVALKLVKPTASAGSDISESPAVVRRKSH